MVFSDSIKAYFFGICASSCFVSSQIFAKAMSQVVNPIQILQIRAFLLLALNTTLIYSDKGYGFSKPSINQKEWLKQPNIQVEYYSLDIKNSRDLSFLLRRFLVSTIGVGLVYTSIKYLPLAIINALFNTLPIISIFLEAVYYKRPVAKIELLLTTVAFVGVLIIIKPFEVFGQLFIGNGSSAETGSSKPYMVFFPLLAAFTMALAYIYLHELKGKINRRVVLQYGYFINLFSYSLYLMTLEQETSATSEQLQSQSKQKEDLSFGMEGSIWDPYFVLSMALMTIFTYGANFFRTKSVFLIAPSKTLPFNYIEIILSLLYDYLIFGHSTTLIEFMGIFLTSIGLLSKLLLEIFEQRAAVD